jgi:hypothetical protein
MNEDRTITLLREVKKDVNDAQKCVQSMIDTLTKYLKDVKEIDKKYKNNIQ